MGKRMIEDMVLDELRESFPRITRREITDDWSDDFERVEGSPDFVVGVDGKAMGIELAEIRNAGDAAGYYAEASRLTWQKHESYERRGLFANPIILLLHSKQPALFDIQGELEALCDAAEFDGTGFAEVWAIDFSDEYFSAGHPLRFADMFCFKPDAAFGFRRVGDHGRKPFG